MRNGPWWMAGSMLLGTVIAVLVIVLLVLAIGRLTRS